METLAIKIFTVFPKWGFNANFKNLIFSHLFSIAFIFQVRSLLQKLRDRNFYSSHLFLNRPFCICLSRGYFYVYNNGEILAFVDGVHFKNGVEVPASPTEKTIICKVTNMPTIAQVILLIMRWQLQQVEIEHLVVFIISDFFQIAWFAKYFSAKFSTFTVLFKTWIESMTACLYMVNQVGKTSSLEF